MATLDSNDLGNIQSENQTKESGLFNQPVPYSDSDETFQMDLFGTTRIISISGTFTGTLAEIKAFILAIETIQNGQQTGVDYVGDLVTTSKTVLIHTFSWDYIKANINSLKYNLKLSEGTVI